MSDHVQGLRTLAADSFVPNKSVEVSITLNLANLKSVSRSIKIYLNALKFQLKIIFKGGTHVSTTVTDTESLFESVLLFNT